MFNQDNYHWTQDDHTKQALDKISEILGRKSITFTPDTSYIYITQRMGRKSTRFEISGSLLAGAESLHVTNFNNISTPEEIADSPLKKPFLDALEETTEFLLALEKAPRDVKITEKVHIPRAKSEAKFEPLKFKILFLNALSHVRETVFSLEMLGAVNSEVSLGEKSFSHPALSMRIIREEGLRRECEFSMDGRKFESVLLLGEKDTGSFLSVTSEKVPCNFSERFIAYVEQVLIKPFERTLGIRYTVQRE
ncbi:uncharacterized protein NEMAJ01_0191 [Nematocida major]|uniref:uncharacterized protein n=1 Tax=Nematocida major TaxID=1912982 RepID=UPI00200819DB|nr:uncharacterized protein NEMAJ01_0191 [Nematocida major]KAH9385295.1 hypothetical protein NEMAJ01_0191 [Nematocida major]